MTRLGIFGSLLICLAGSISLAHATNDVHADVRVQTTSSEGMSLVQAVVLGAVEGVTEYLPVSSTGHLILAQRIMGIGQTAASKEAADAYSVCIQIGAILAVLGVFFPHVRRLGNGLIGRDPDGRRLLIQIALAFLPAALVGLTLSGPIKTYLFGLWPVVIAWAAGGAAILGVAWHYRRRSSVQGDGVELERLTYRGALLIGVLQCVAVWPGVSRSLVTIVGGVLAGLNLPAAVLFSFLLGALTLTAATLHDGWSHGQLLLEHYSLGNMIVGGVVALGTAMVSVKWMLSYLQRNGLAIFGTYRLVLALIVAILLSQGILSDQVNGL